MKYFSSLIETIMNLHWNDIEFDSNVSNDRIYWNCSENTLVEVVLD